MGLGIGNYAPIIAYICTMVVLFMTIFYKIEFGIYFMVLMIPLQTLINAMQAEGYPLGKDIIDLFIVILLIKWFFNREDSREVSVDHNAIKWTLSLFVIWLYIELWLGSFNLRLPFPINIRDPRVQFWVVMLRMVLLYFIVVGNIKTEKQIQYLFFVIVFSALLVTYKFYGQSAGLRGAGYFDYKMKGIGGTFSSLGSDGVAAFCALYGIIFFTMTLMVKNNWHRLVLGFTTFMSYFTVVWCFSRVGYLAALVGFAFIGLIKNRLVGIALIMFILFWEAFVPGAVRIRINQTLNEEGDLDASAQDRLDFWEQAKDHISSNPLFGTGFRTAYLIGFEGRKMGRGEEGRAGSVHNEYLEVIMEIGAIGVLLYFGIVFLAMRSGWKLYCMADEGFYKGLGLGFVACNVARLVANVTQVTWTYINIMGFYFISLALVTRSIMNLEKGQKSTVIVENNSGDAPNSEKFKPRIQRTFKGRQRQLRSLKKPVYKRDEISRYHL